MGTAKYLPLINKSDSYKLKVSDISSVIRRHRKIEIKTDHGSYTTYDKMDNVARYLGDNFVRYVDGGAVNLDKIDHLKNMSIYFNNGDVLKPGRDGYIKIRQRFNAYLLNLPVNR